MNKYLDIIYSKERTPISNYPLQLTKYLCKLFQIKQEDTLLDIATGRGDFLSAFLDLYIQAEGCDTSKFAGSIAKEKHNAKIRFCDVSKDKMPYADNTFNFLFHKSLLEHLDSPGHFLQECHRILKPGGTIICMVPDWESNMRTYFDDFTHRTPYTKYSLKDALEIFGFQEVQTRTFKQLPITWENQLVDILSSSIAPFVPPRTKNKFLRWSKELMILGSGKKSNI